MYLELYARLVSDVPVAVAVVVHKFSKVWVSAREHATCTRTTTTTITIPTTTALTANPPILLLPPPPPLLLKVLLLYALQLL